MRAEPILKRNGHGCPPSPDLQGRTNYVEPKFAELSGQDRSGGCDGCLDVRVLDRALIRFLLFPYRVNGNPSASTYDPPAGARVRRDHCDAGDEPHIHDVRPSPMHSLWLADRRIPVRHGQ